MKSRNMFGSISFVSGNGLRNGLDNGGILGSILFVLKISDIFRWWRNILGSISFVLQISLQFWAVEEY